MLRGLPQSAFAPEVSAKQVARIEAGEISSPRAKTIARLAKKLGVSPEKLRSY